MSAALLQPPAELAAGDLRPADRGRWITVSDLHFGAEGGAVVATATTFTGRLRGVRWGRTMRSGLRAGTLALEVPLGTVLLPVLASDRIVADAAPEAAAPVRATAAVVVALAATVLLGAAAAVVAGLALSAPLSGLGVAAGGAYGSAALTLRGLAFLRA